MLNDPNLAPLKIKFKLAVKVPKEEMAPEELEPEEESEEEPVLKDKEVTKKILSYLKNKAPI